MRISLSQLITTEFDPSDASMSGNNQIMWQHMMCAHSNMLLKIWNANFATISAAYSCDFVISVYDLLAHDAQGQKMHLEKDQQQTIEAYIVSLCQWLFPSHHIDSVQGKMEWNLGQDLMAMSCQEDNQSGNAIASLI